MSRGLSSLNQGAAVALRGTPRTLGAVAAARGLVLAGVALMALVRGRVPEPS